MRLLDAFAASGSEMALTAVAAATGMHPSKAHRYLVSLTRAGYIAQDSATGLYGLGPRSTALGLAAMRQLDVVRLAADIMNDLRDLTGQTISMVTWANHGPTIVSVREADTPIMVTVRVGSVLPLLTSSNGQIFLAYLPPRKVKPFIDAELATAKRNPRWKGPRTVAGVTRQIRDIRQRRMSRSESGVTTGIVSLAAPVFDHRGEIVCSIALVSPVGTLSLSWTGSPARALADAAARLSERLGLSRRDQDAISRSK